MWQAWKEAGRLIGDFIARAVLTLFYFSIFVPFGLVIRFFQDPLHLATWAEKSYWVKRELREPSLDDARRGF